MNTFWILLWGLIIASIWMCLLWLVATAWRNAAWADVGWSLGVGILILFFAFSTDGYVPRVVMVTSMGSLWSLRLGIYLLRHRIIGMNEEGRYQTLRNNWGDRASFYFFQFFQAQGVLILLFSVPPLIAMSHPSRVFRITDILGLGIWFLSQVGESLADWQLAAFRSRADNRGKTCRTGLWRYSRHPNYFFEWMQWWSYVAVSIGAPYGWLTLSGPVVMLFFLFMVTGIPATEAQAIASRREDYQRYQRSTNAFFPWFPKGEEDR
jgi:steroid 5-alpha reductase family enzyme